MNFFQYVSQPVFHLQNSLFSEIKRCAFSSACLSFQFPAVFWGNCVLCPVIVVLDPIFSCAKHFSLNWEKLKFVQNNLPLKTRSGVE